MQEHDQSRLQDAAGSITVRIQKHRASSIRFWNRFDDALFIVRIVPPPMNLAAVWETGGFTGYNEVCLFDLYISNIFACRVFAG
jgi:hypothetical protein